MGAERNAERGGKRGTEGRGEHGARGGGGGTVGEVRTRAGVGAGATQGSDTGEAGDTDGRMAGRTWAGGSWCQPMAPKFTLKGPVA